MCSVRCWHLKLSDRDGFADCMRPRSATVTLSLSLPVSVLVLYIALHLELEIDSDMTSTERFVCMGCSAIAGSSRPVSFFPTFKAAACHYARSPACQKTGRAIRQVTIQSRSTDREAGGSGAGGKWVPPTAASGGDLLNYIAWYISSKAVKIYHTYITPCGYSTRYAIQHHTLNMTWRKINGKCHMTSGTCHIIYHKKCYVP
jgi:hypothetical protein